MSCVPSACDLVCAIVQTGTCLPKPCCTHAHTWEKGHSHFLFLTYCFNFLFINIITAMLCGILDFSSPTTD